MIGYVLPIAYFQVKLFLSGQSDNARPFRDASILRLQLRRIPQPLAVDATAGPQDAQDLPR